MPPMRDALSAMNGFRIGPRNTESGCDLSLCDPGECRLDLLNVSFFI